MNIRKEIRLEMRVKNNALYKAIHETHRSVGAFAAAHGLRMVSVHRLLLFRDSPFTKAREYRKICLDLSRVTGIGVEELFPAHLYDAVKNPVKVVEIDSFTAIGYAGRRVLAALPAPDDFTTFDDAEVDGIRKALVASILKTLTSREAEVLKLRFGIGVDKPYTLDECARIFRVGRERVRQIEAKGMRKLQHPARSEKLEDFVKHSAGETWLD
jgi:hypothetical protein